LRPASYGPTLRQQLGLERAASRYAA
jgi:hypothetical protein